MVYLSRDQNFPVGRFAPRSLAYSRFNTVSVTGKVADTSAVAGAQVVPDGIPASVERKVTLMGIVQPSILLNDTDLRVDGVSAKWKCRFWAPINFQTNMISTVNAHAGSPDAA